MKVRGITVDDVENLIDLARLMHSESPAYRHIPFSDVAMRTWFFAAIERPNDVFCHVAETDDGILMGSMLAVAAPFIFSEKRLGMDLGLFVFEQFRGTFAAFRLERQFSKWIKAVGCVRIATGVSVGINNPEATDFYQRLGYQPLGVSLFKEIA